MSLWQGRVDGGSSILDSLKFEKLNLNDTQVKKSLEEFAKDYKEKQKECEDKGHPNAASGMRCYSRGRLTINMHCPDCHDSYQRGPTVEESTSFDKMTLERIY